MSVPTLRRYHRQVPLSTKKDTFIKIFYKCPPVQVPKDEGRLWMTVPRAPHLAPSERLASTGLIQFECILSLAPLGNLRRGYTLRKIFILRLQPNLFGKLCFREIIPCKEDEAK